MFDLCLYCDTHLRKDEETSEAVGFVRRLPPQL